MSSSDVKELVREELQEAYEYWMNQANTRTDGQRKEIASRLAAAEVSALYGQGEIYDEYENAVLAAIAFEEQKREESEEDEESGEVTATAENVQEYQNEEENSESEKSEQAFAEEENNDPLDLVIDGENISDIKDAVRGEELSNEELDSMIIAEEDKSNPRSTLIDWLENRKSDETEDDIMEIGAE